MAELSTQNITDAGTAPAFTSASASDTAEIGSGHNTFVVYQNDGDETTFTVIAPGNTAYGQPQPDPVITVPADGEVWVPLRKEYDPGDGSGRATITHSGAPDDVSVAVVRMS